MKAKSAVYAVLFLLISVLIVSCHKDAGALCSTISRVEKCIDTYPDSALNLLKKIPHPEKLHGKLQADYALLMTQAMDKNYMKFDSDSLIAIALNYYTVDQRNPILLAKAQFYYGRVMLELDQQEKALEYFLVARKIYESIPDSKMLALIVEEIGMINRIQNIYKKALFNFHTSLTLHKQLKDTFSIVRANQNIARIHLYQNKWDSCFYYFSVALNLAQQKNYKSKVSILHELGILYRSINDLNKAEKYFLAAYEQETDIEKKYMESLSLGFLYMKMDRISEARKYLLEGAKSSNLSTIKDVYACLFELEKGLKNYQIAISYIEKSDSAKQIISDLNSKTEIAKLQKKYDNEKLLNENLQIRMKYVNSIAFGAISLIVVIFFLCYYYYKNRNNKKRIAEIESKIRNNEEEIGRYQHEIAVIYDSKQQLAEESRTKVGELNGKIMILTMQNETLAEQLRNLGVEVNEITTKRYIPAFYFLLALKEGTYKGKMSNEYREQLLELFDFIYQNCASRLQNKYSSMTKHELKICCLIIFGMTNEELGLLFGTTTDSVTKAKGRIKRKLNLTSRDDLEHFLRCF